MTASSKLRLVVLSFLGEKRDISPPIFEKKKADGDSRVKKAAVAVRVIRSHVY